MVVEDEGRAEQAEAQRLADLMADAVRRLTAEFHEIHQAKMRDVPFSNKALHVEPVGFRVWEGRFLGVLVAPWFMNLTVLPGPDEDWSALKPGEKERIAFPSGTYEFLHNVRPMAGGYKGCSLFSPMHEFDSQAAAVAVAGAVMPALFDPANRDEGARTDEIRETRETEIAAAEAAAAAPNTEPTRRGVMGAAPREDGDA
jgi:[NiFe] hydrogenase assembly chaperone, HybE family